MISTNIAFESEKEHILIHSLRYGEQNENKNKNKKKTHAITRMLIMHS